MERKFAIPNPEDKSNYEIYSSLVTGGYIENNSEPSEIDGQLRLTFSLTMKGWQSFPLNRGGQQTCIHWVVPDHAKAILRTQSQPNGRRAITYERDMSVLPDWLSSAMRARYQSHGYIELPESIPKKIEYFFSARYGELSKNSPERIRSRFPSDDKVMGMAQGLLDNRLRYGKEPCVPIGGGYIESKNFWSRDLAALPILYFSTSIDAKHLQMLRLFVREGYLQELKLDVPLQTPKGIAIYAFQITSKYLGQLETNEHKTCVWYGRAVAKEVVTTPDGQSGYIQYFVIRYVIEDLQSWINLPGMFENLPESARLCIKSGSLIQVHADNPGNGGGPGCSLSWF